MKRNGKIYKNYYDTKPTNKHILITGNFADVIYDDFQEHLNIYNINIFEKKAEKEIENYIDILLHQMQDDIDEKERETIENIIKRILLDYCQSIPF